MKLFVFVFTKIECFAIKFASERTNYTILKTA